MAKRESRDQKRKRKLAKRARREEKKAPVGFYEATESDGLVTVTLVFPASSGTPMPELVYEGQEALDRARRWLIAYAEGRVRAAASAQQGDPAWFNAPAFGNPQDARWEQGPHPRGSTITFHARGIEVPLGVALDDNEVGARFDDFAEALWPVLMAIPEAEIVRRLHAQVEGSPVKTGKVFACGWCFVYSYGELPGGRAFHQFSARLRPFNRSDFRDDWNLLGGVMSALGMPNPNDPAQHQHFIERVDLTDKGLDHHARLTWRWRAEGA